MTELIWEGKYRDGKKVAPLRLPLRFQDVETVNEPAHTRQLMLDLWARNQPTEWRNRLIWGDKKYVLPSLLQEFAGKVNLVYIDPPFVTGADFSFTATIPDDLDNEGDQTVTFTKQPSIIEQKAYRDTWGRGLDSYLQWFYETIAILHELISQDGSIYVHLDWHVGHYAKSVLDEIFGSENFRSEIVWKRTAAHNDSKGIGNVTDMLLYYVASDRSAWNPQFVPFSEDYLEAFYRHFEADGRRYRLHQIERNAAIGVRPNLIYPYNGYTPKYGWMVEEEKLREFDRKGMLVWSKNGKPQRKIYLNEDQGKPITNLWDDIPPVQSQAIERAGYPTQKPEALIERIINASSNEGDLILDCFAGSGTTAVVAEKLGRRWITADLGRFAIHTTRKRLLSLPEVRPFVVQNLGKYERQSWQAAEFGGDKEKAALVQARYRQFILDLYGAQPIDGYTWLHGVRAGRMVHVGSVDAPVVEGDIKQIAQEFWRVARRGGSAEVNAVDVLGWDFAFELNEMGKQMAADANVRLTFKRIPREVLEKKAVEQGDIQFFELAALSTDVTTEGLGARVALRDFVVSPDDVPEDVRRAISHWSQWIDYWAVDWDYQGDTFHNEWQAYRTRKSPKLQLDVTHTYAAPGSYTILIKVIDILGNDTTKSVKVEVK